MREASPSASDVHPEAHSLAEFSAKRRWDVTMLRKCANPACTVPFRSLREGKLFLAEAPPCDVDAAFDGPRKKVPRREHFWLCAACSAHFTLRFDTEQGMMTVPLNHDVELRWLTRVGLVNC